MAATIRMERALDDLERRLDSLEEKVNTALEQSVYLLEYVKNNPSNFAQARTVTRRIILEETRAIPETTE
jgi:hypothetical protein